jgi:hypothetical protein
MMSALRPAAEAAACAGLLLVAASQALVLLGVAVAGLGLLLWRPPLALGLLPPAALLAAGLYSAHRAYVSLRGRDYAAAFRYASLAMLGELVLLPYVVRTWLGLGNRWLGLALGAGAPLSLLAIIHMLGRMPQRGVAVRWPYRE